MLFHKGTTPGIIVKGPFLISTQTDSCNHALPSTLFHQRKISKTVLNTWLGSFLHSPVFAVLRITIMSGDEKRKKNILSVYIKFCHIGNQNYIKALHIVYRGKKVSSRINDGFSGIFI